MTTRLSTVSVKAMALFGAALVLTGASSLPAHAQQTEAEPAIELLDPVALDTLVAPIALYPDDLLAIVLPASTYPLQVVEAQRFLSENAGDTNAEPDPVWDDAIVAMLNYPEALELLNDDLDWTWSLGQAVLSQQADVLEAVERFRDQAYLAGNLASDEYQRVSREAERIVIEPADPEVIYVPYYDPVQVVVRQPRPVFFYHPHAYPLYYYPYAVGHRFYRDPFFWGVSTAFAISWRNRYLHLNYFDTIHHPFYGFGFNNRRFFRHRHSRDYFVRGGTGRFDRRVRDYRWFPNRFHGVRPNYARHSRAGRQLTYQRDGYTRARTVERGNRQRFTGNSRGNRLGQVGDNRRRGVNRNNGDTPALRGGNRDRGNANIRQTRGNADGDRTRNRFAAGDRQRSRSGADAGRRSEADNRSRGRSPNASGRDTTLSTRDRRVASDSRRSERRLQHRGRDNGNVATRNGNSRLANPGRTRADNPTVVRRDTRVRDTRTTVRRDRTVTPAQSQRSRAVTPQRRVEQRRASPQRQVQTRRAEPQQRSAPQRQAQTRRAAPQRQATPQRQARQSSRGSEPRASSRSASSSRSRSASGSRGGGRSSSGRSSRRSRN